MISLVMAYYENSKMLAHHYDQWMTYGPVVRTNFEIVIVDDGSPKNPAGAVPRPEGIPRLRIFRVLEDRLWHQNGARNLGANAAVGDWLFLTDMDHVVPEKTLLHVMKQTLKPMQAFNFHRLDAATMLPTLDRFERPKPHPNTWLISKDLYWKIGGYDERTCGYYGTDSFFRQKVMQVARIKTLPFPVLRYTLDDVPDASTVGFARKEGRTRGWRDELKRKIAADPRPHNLRFEWEQVL